MRERMPIMIGEDAIEKFIEFCREGHWDKFLVVADENTAAALGNRVHAAIAEQGWDVIYCVLDPEDLHTDGVSITRALNAYDAVPRLFVAVGSGTITDICRFASHRSQNKFISFPTAPSVDAYTSKNAPVTVGHLKGSIYCHAPIAIFTHLPTITEAPQFLKASGFGDLVTKMNSSTDWKNSHIIWDTDFDEEIYQRSLNAGQRVAAVVDEIKNNDPESMVIMMESQFESGFCMADFNNSAPASGAEHHMAHIWEMVFHWSQKEGLFHGHAVGVAAIMCAEWYQKLRALSKADAEDLLTKAVIPSQSEQITALKSALPLIADEVIDSDPIYLQLCDPEKFKRTKERIIDKWEDIQACAENIPDPAQLRAWIAGLGGPVSPQELNLTEDQEWLGREFGHYLRERFSINILRKLFNWE